MSDLLRLEIRDELTIVLKQNTMGHGWTWIHTDKN
jgi:hypothetical protein